jgi:hypothetical protein
MAAARELPRREKQATTQAGGRRADPNAIIDLLVQVVAIALITAILSWILGVLGAPDIMATIIWILALLAILIIVFQALSGRTAVGRGRRPPAGDVGDPATRRSRRPPPGAAP